MLSKSRSILALIAVFAVAAAILIVIPQTPATAASGSLNVSAERSYFKKLNDTRAANGLAPVKMYWNLTDDARKHSAAMLSAGRIYHTSPLSGVVPSGWQALAENVGAGPSISSLHTAFMNSSGHKRNILGNYNYVGIGVYRSTSGQYWITVIFARYSSSATFSTFKDTDGNAHRASIEYIWKEGVTSGCGSSLNQTFCPSNNVTRAELAVFLDNAVDFPSTSKDYFNDDNGKWYEGAINRAAAAGVVSGTGYRRYSPTRTVTRGEAAKMLVKSFKMPMAPSSKNYFVDDNGKWYENYADTLRYHGITSGCGSSKFCGSSTLRRDHMATFLQRSMVKF